jgi:hypothetical protein
MAMRAAVLAMLGALTPAFAHGEATRLVVRRGPGAQGCPDETALRAAVVDLLRYDPFAAAGPRTIRARVSRSRAGFEAVVDLQDAAGSWQGVRHLESSRADCGPLAAALVLAIAIAIDPMMAGSAPPPEDRPASERPTPASPPPALAAEHVPAHTPAVGLFGASAHAALGAAPGPAPGFDLWVGRRRGPFSLQFAARLDLPGSRDAGGGQVSGWVAMGTALACLHHGVLFGCGALGGGVRRMAGHDLEDPRQVTRPIAVAGARVAVLIPLHDDLSALVHADVFGEIVETTVRVGGRRVWDTPPVSGAAGAGLVANFR